MNLLINIGNTHVQIARYVAGKMKLIAICPTEEVILSGTITALEQLEERWTARAVCVVPAAQRVLSLRFASVIRFLNKDDFSTLDFSLVDSATIGMDRIANAAAAYRLAGGAATVIDFGTCVNTVSIDAQGRFLGGAILPGRVLLRKALHLYTGQLPMIPLSEEAPAPVGTTTVSAMQAGVDLGIVGSVRHLLQETERSLGEKRIVYATGGDAAFFMNAISELRNAPPFLTLQGVRLATPV